MPNPHSLRIPRRTLRPHLHQCPRQRQVVWGPSQPHQTRRQSRLHSSTVQRSALFFQHSLPTAPHSKPHLSVPQAPDLRTQQTRRSYTSDKMATEFQKVTKSQGDGSNYPKQGDVVTMEYTGWLYDPSAPDNKGAQFDSSVGRGDFETAIGVGRVIKGWDQGVPQMSIGEKATLIIPGHMAYGSRGFPGLIPPNATLMFDVHLKKIN